jgi:endonuclease III-like uncharacterized protein
MELEYILVVPINGEQKEDSLSLILGYHIYVPEKMMIGNYSREKLQMFTGPGPTIYGDKMWYPQNLEDREIKISYILSQNENISDFPEKQENDVNKERLNALQKTFVDQNNQMILSGMGQSQEKTDHISELEKTVNNLKKQLQFVEEDKERQLLQYKQKELMGKNKNIMMDYATNFPQLQSDNRMSQENQGDTMEYQQFLEFKSQKETFQKQLEDHETRLRDLQNPMITRYEPLIKNISVISKGVLDLVLNEPEDSYIDFALEKELCKHGLATIFNFQFLSFKPSKSFYKELRFVPDKIQFFFDFFNEKNYVLPYVILYVLKIVVQKIIIISIIH